MIFLKGLQLCNHHFFKLSDVTPGPIYDIINLFPSWCILTFIMFYCFENGSKRYEGDWQNSKPHGKAISYYENGNKKYEGDWFEDKPHGKGILYYGDGNKWYEGDLQNNKRHGKDISY